VDVEQEFLRQNDAQATLAVLLLLLPPQPHYIVAILALVAASKLGC